MSAKVAVWGPVYGSAFRYLDDENTASCGRRCRHSKHAEAERWLDAVCADLQHETRQCIELRWIKLLRLPVVRHAKHHPTACGVAERCQSVGERIAARRGDLAATERDFL